MAVTEMDKGLAVSTAPQVKSGSARGRSGRLVRAARLALWPVAVRGGRNVFVSYRALTGLRALGLEIDRVRIDIRSVKGLGFWILAPAFGGVITNGPTLTEATLNLVKLIAGAQSDGCAPSIFRAA